MDTKEWFSVGVRIIGLLACLRGCEDFIWVLMANLGYTSVTNSSSHTATFILGLFYFFAGLYLLRGANHLINFAFSNNLTSINNSNIEQFDSGENNTETN